MTSVISGALLMLGAVFTMLAGIGTLRFTDVYSRMHPAAKGPTLGLVLVSVGAAVELRSTPAILALILVVVLQFLSAPVGAHLLGRAIHVSLPLGAESIDELAEDLRKGPGSDGLGDRSDPERSDPDRSGPESTP